MTFIEPEPLTQSQCDALRAELVQLRAKRPDVWLLLSPSGARLPVVGHAEGNVLQVHLRHSIPAWNSPAGHWRVTDGTSWWAIDGAFEPPPPRGSGASNITRFNMFRCRPPALNL